jgi:uncharacterized protein
VSLPLVRIAPRVATRGSTPEGRLFVAGKPRMPQAHVFNTDSDPHVLVVDGTRIYQVEPPLFEALTGALDAQDEARVDEFLAKFGLSGDPYVDDGPPVAPPIRALSLAVAQKCNLGCTYCYAQEGSFGSPPKEMPLEVALASVDLLFSGVQPDERVNLSFLGGEPLTNRNVLRAATRRAARIADERGAEVTFSITTNGTVLTPEDGQFFEQFGFAVTLSIDGLGSSHDRLRPLKSGKGSYDLVIAKVKPLLAMQRRMQVSARVTVTPLNLEIRDTLDGLIEMGFHSVGFSPMLSSPTGREEMDAATLEVMLEQMVSCGEEFERSVVSGRRYPFTNMVNAMTEIHKGTHRPYPCGAGAGYLGVSSEGDLFACHRFVDDATGAMGNISTGPDQQRRQAWLSERHVHRQEPCRSCWARYMCGGGCHHEVIKRGRPSCDYIRGWLHYCLEAYVRLSEQRPDYFGMNAAVGE